MQFAGPLKISGPSFLVEGGGVALWWGGQFRGKEVGEMWVRVKEGWKMWVWVKEGWGRVGVTLWGGGDPLASLGNDGVAFLLALLEDQDLVRKRSRPPPPHPPPPPLRIIEPQ